MNKCSNCNKDSMEICACGRCPDCHDESVLRDVMVKMILLEMTMHEIMSFVANAHLEETVPSLKKGDGAPRSMIESVDAQYVIGIVAEMMQDALEVADKIKEEGNADKNSVFAEFVNSIKKGGDSG